MPCSRPSIRQPPRTGWRRLASQRCAAAGLLLLALIARTAGAEHLNLRTYSIAEGLAQSEVKALLQDRKGYLWLATNGGGVNRFDGRRFENFSQAEGLPGDAVRALAEDPSGAIWMGTNEGAARFDGERITAFTTREGLSHHSVRSLTVTRTGELLVGTNAGIDVRTGAGFRPYVKFPDAAPRAIYSLLQDRKGRLWAGTLADGLWCFEGAAAKHFGAAEGVTRPVTALLEDREGRFWLGTNGGLLQLAGGRARRPPGDLPVLDAPVWALMQDREGVIWVGSSVGVGRLSGTSMTAWTVRQGLPSDVVSSFLEDRQGSLWFGTEGGGVAQFVRGAAFTHYTEADGLPSKVVWGFGRDAESKLWSLTSDGPVALRGAGASSSFAAPPQPLAGTRVMSLHPDRHGNTWFATEKGLFRYDGTWAQVTSDPVRGAIVEDPDGSLWIGTLAGLIHVREGRLQRFKDDRGGPWVSALHRDSRGALWVGTTTGVLRFDGEKFERPAELSAALDGTWVPAIAEDADGNLWLATIGRGVVRYRPATSGAAARVDFLRVADGLSSNTAYFLLFDDRGKLWIGTAKGLDCLDWRRFRGGGQPRLRHYGAAEGYFGVEGNMQAAFMDRDGTLWFGTVAGAVHYDPRADRRNTLPPTTEVRSIRLFQKPTDWRSRGFAVRGALPERLTLPYSANSLTFDYVGVSLILGERVTYLTKLEGGEPDWSPPTHATSATYTNLPAGRYTFRVKSCNSDGVCSEASSRFSFIIRPAFWATWWFRSLLVAVLGGAIYGGHHLRVERLERRRRELEQLVQDRTTELERANAELERLASADGLTGLANRRCFNERLEEEWRRARRNQTSLSLVLLDVDHFKLFNDTYGHLEGDACLRQVAQVLLASASRPADLAARYGGEEFVLLLPDTASAGALHAAQRIRKDLARIAIPHRASKTSDVVTVSVGFATIEPRADGSPAALVAQADDALYQAKQSGRDAVMAAAA
jgi:diguanylate cyclase (GGDEF)-like protein